MKVQMKSHGWHDVEVNGNLITGDTYVCKDMIKKYLGGKWKVESVEIAWPRLILTLGDVYND